MKRFFRLVITLILLGSSFGVARPNNISAQTAPAPDPASLSFEAVSNQEIVHKYKVNGEVKAHSFKPPYVIPGSSFTNGAYQKEHLVYETGYKDIYFAVNLANYKASGIFRKKNNKLERLFYSGANWVAKDFPEITNEGDLKYINLLSRASSDGNITNMTPSTMPSKSLPSNKVRVTVDYNEESDGYKNLKPEHLERAKLGLAPENMPCYLFYAPETSIWFSHTAIKKVAVDKNGDLDFGTIEAHKGWYKAICQFHIMTPNATGAGEKARFDWDQAWYEAGFYTGVSAWASTVAGSLENIAGTIVSWIDKVEGEKAATGWLRDNYWAAYTVHLSDLEASTNIPLDNMEMKNETALNDTLTPFGNKDSSGVCNSPNSDIISMVEEGFCALTVTLKKWADSFFKWAVGWMELSIGITRNQTKEVADNIELPEAQKTDSASAPTTSTATEETPKVGNGTATPNKIIYPSNEDLIGTGYEKIGEDLCVKATTDYKLDSEPCLIKNLTYTDPTGLKYTKIDTKAGIQIVSGGLSTFLGSNKNGTAKNPHNKCGADVEAFIILKTNCAFDGTFGAVKGTR